MTPFPGTPIHEMALRGEGGYRLLSGGWEDFDKYSSGVLELETVSLGRLKRYQIACYLNLYVRNRRFRSWRPRRRESRGRLGDAALGGRADRARDASALGSDALSGSPRPSPRRRYARAEVVDERGQVAQVTSDVVAAMPGCAAAAASSASCAPRARRGRRGRPGAARRRREQDEVEEPARVAQMAVRDTIATRCSGPSRRSIPPRRRISQECSNMRIFRPYSSSMSRAGFSHANASGLDDRRGGRAGRGDTGERRRGRAADRARCSRSRRTA